MSQMNNHTKSVNDREITGEMLEILKTVTFEDSGIEVEFLANRFNISKPKALYYLDELMARDYVHSFIALGSGGTFFHPTIKGRKYLFDHGLL